MSRIIGIGVLVLVAVVGWKIGEMLNPQSIGMALGVIFGMMAGVPAALIALSASRVRGHVDVHHHHHTEQPTEPQKQTQAMITAQPQRYTVLDNPQQPGAITGAQHGRLEVLQ